MWTEIKSVPVDSESEPRPRKLITVCDACLCASCFQGHFYCEEAKFAGIKEISADALERLDLESPHYWVAEQ